MLKEKRHFVVLTRDMRTDKVSVCLVTWDEEYAKSVTDMRNSYLDLYYKTWYECFKAQEVAV